MDLAHGNVTHTLLCQLMGQGTPVTLVTKQLSDVFIKNARDSLYIQLSSCAYMPLD